MGSGPSKDKFQKFTRSTAQITIKRTDDNEGIMQVLHGNPNYNCPRNTRIVRVFTSSTFTDTMHERNALMERVYPRLKTFCQEKGYEFQVVDMRWGIRDEAQNDHQTTELCLKEIKACQKLSVGPCFVTFLSHKYGYQPIPRTIESDVFDVVTSTAEPSEKLLLDKWYIKDENYIPPRHVLQPINHVIPQFTSLDQNLANKAKAKWWQHFDILQAILISGSIANLTSENKKRDFVMSVTEKEIELGVLSNADVSDGCLWFNREIYDIDDQPDGSELAAFKENGNDHSEQSQKLLMDLRKSKLPSKLPSSNIINYKVKWHKGGIDPDTSDHRDYIDHLCRDFEHHTRQLIERNVQEKLKAEISDPAYNEALLHTTFALTKCKMFHGRSAILSKIESYITNPNKLPLIVHGSSGSGKTSLLAMAARASWDWLDRKAALVYRFIGTSQNSFSVRPLLKSLNQQLHQIYVSRTMCRKTDSSDLKALIDEFQELLRRATGRRPLMLLLDSLDQLDSVDGGRQLDWLPRELPAHVHLILSTLPDDKYGILDRCKLFYPRSCCYVDVPKLTKDDTNGILDKWLGQADRKVTFLQRKIIVESLEKCPIPLFLKLSFDEAVKWHSYDKPDITILHNTVEASINALFERVEKTHGRLITSRALSYLTIAENGITEVEMEDILSLDDNVLNDVYEYWTPPMRRLPPLLWVRIRNDLSEYLVDRGVDGFQLIYWYHRQFIETAQKRYLSNANFKVFCHRAFADYYLGSWADKPKPYKSRDGTEGAALRYVNQQPLRYPNGKYNSRMLSQLPYHLVHAGEKTVLKQRVFCNYEFLLAKMICLGFSSVLSDFRWCQTVATTRDRDFSVVLETLQLSQDALETHPSELAGQLLGRIHGYGSDTVNMVSQARAMLRSKRDDEELTRVVVTLVQMLELLMAEQDKKNKMLDQLLKGAKQSSIQTLVPHTGFLVPPGGQLLHKLSGHFDKVNDIAISPDGRKVATASDDLTVKIWLSESGDLQHSVDIIEGAPMFLCFGQSEHLLVSCTNHKLYVVDSEGGLVINDVTHKKGGFDARPMAIFRNEGNEDLILLMREHFIDVLHLKDGSLKCSIADGLKNAKSFNENKLIASSGQLITYCSYVDNDFYVLYLDSGPIDKMKFKKINVFQREATYTNKHEMDHITALSVQYKFSPNQHLVALCNGRTEDILIYGLPDALQLRRFSGSTFDAEINYLCFSKDGSSVVAAADGDIKIIPLTNNEGISTILHHPCHINKVLKASKDEVVSLAEDNILRIWNLGQEPFSPDMSTFTGQVGVNSAEDQQGWQSTIDNMFENFSDDYKESAKDLLVSKQSKQYWNSTDNQKSKVVTRFFEFPANEHYLAVTQNQKCEVTNRSIGICLSIWQVPEMTCVRRLFTDTKVTFYCVIEKALFLISYQKGNEHVLEMLNLQDWSIQSSLNGASLNKNSTAIFDKINKDIYISMNQCSINIYKKDKPDPNHIIQCNSLSNSEATFNKLQLITNQRLMAAVYDHVELVVVVCCTRSHTCLQTLKPQKGDFSLGLQLYSTAGNDHVIVSSFNFFAVVHEKQGLVCDKIISKDSPAPIGTQCFPVLHKSTDGERFLKLVYLDKNIAVETCSVSLGRNANCMTYSGGGGGGVGASNGARCVTWCSEPKEQRIAYWDLEDIGEIKAISTFTPEETNDVIHFSPINRYLMINSSSGLILLRLVQQTNEEDEMQPIQATMDEDMRLYQGIDLNVRLSLVTE